MSYSLDLRQRVVEFYEAGDCSYEDAAEHHRVGRASVSRWLRLNRENGTPAQIPPNSGRPRSVDKKGEAIIVSLIEAKPDITIRELRLRYNRRRKRAPVSATTLWRTVHNVLGFSRKKRRFVRRSVTV